MGNTFFRYMWWRWIGLTVVFMATMKPSIAWGQTGGEATAEELANMGFENVRWTETETERIFSFENSTYRSQARGIAEAIDIIQKSGMHPNKSCKIIVTHLDIPQISLTCAPTFCDSIKKVAREDWTINYNIEDSWNKVKKEVKKNNTQFKVDILIYPQLSYMNLIITQIYQVLFDLNPTIEVSLWKGSKLTGQIKVPVYNDGYGILEDKVHPGFITLSQRVRLPYNIFGKATIGYFNSDRWGIDLSFFHPFKDERFSVEGRIGYVGIGYWDGFKLHYDNKMQLPWSIGGNFYWPKYNTQFSLKAEKYLYNEKGIKFEMIRHFRYASVGFYAMKAENAKSNGGFKIQVALPCYKNRRRGYIPRVNLSKNMGIVYNAGNERKYYRQYKAEASDNIMENNSFNPKFIKNELLNF